MEFEQIKELVKILKNSNLHEICYKEGESQIQLRKSAPVEPAPSQSTHFTPPPPPPTDASAKHQQDLKTSKTEDSPQDKTPQDNTNIFYVESPLVGTFYQSANPDSEPFVKVGSKVKKGDPLCIVEAMKIMNIIESEVDGTVEKIYIENAHFVEYKSKIFSIRKN